MPCWRIGRAGGGRAVAKVRGWGGRAGQGSAGWVDGWVGDEQDEWADALVM